MTKLNSNFRKVQPYLAYLISFILILATAFSGSLVKKSSQLQGLDLESIAKNNFTISSDQLSEFYVMANLANSLDLPSAKVVDINYASVLIMNDIGQTAIDRLEKPLIIDTTHLPRGVTVYRVQNGDTIEKLAEKYKITTTHIRWSNQLKTDQLTVGKDLLIPGTPGIIYTTKNNETLADIAKKYDSNLEHIITYNDLEADQNIKPGTRIILPGGKLPEKERPEYTPPPPPRRPIITPQYNFIVQHSGSNPMPWGWCTWYAWSRRAAMGANYHLPRSLGNANVWDDILGRYYHLNYSPAPGAIFQTDAGYYGHVGIVDSVNPDGTITISDMNGIASWGRVGTKTIPQSQWQKYKYIHGRR